MKSNNVTVVPHTHWDREWYQPFAVFQARLVEVVDAVLDLLEGNDQFSHFMLDGQAVVLEDYLALKPEAEERLRGFVQNGRLAIGPWYTLADEFLSSPEALVRNLLIGRSVCRLFGEPMPVVYTPDSFGHISQLPLLAHGFGFDSLTFERGVGDEGEEIGGEFRWRTADGKHSVLAVHLLTTYSSAAGIGYQDWNRYRNFDGDRAVAHARKALYGGSERIGMEPWLDESLARIEGGSSAYASGSNLLLLNGSDHLPPQTNLPAVIDLLNERFEEATFRLGRLRDYVDGVLAEADELGEYQGEFRGSRYHHVLSGVFSARLYLKQANHAAQQNLERYAEPLSALAYTRGAPYPDSILRGAWKELLRNHCHDSICGCSVDAVHEEMMPRFSGVVASTTYLSRKALAHLGGGYWSVAPGPAIEGRLTPPQGSDSVDAPLLTAFNPHPWRWRGVLSASLPVPAGFRPQSLTGSDGQPVPAELELLSVMAPGDARKREERVKVRWLAELAALSTTSFQLSTQAPADQAPLEGKPEGHAERVRTNGRALENGHLRVTVSRDGLVLDHKASGQRLRAKLSLEDLADAGDEYDFSPLANDEPLTLDLIDFEPDDAQEGLAGSLRATGELRIPARLSDDRTSREGETTLPFEIVLELKAHDPFVRVDLRLQNRALDHRLRLRVDTDVKSEKVAAEGHFDVLERPLAPARADGWFQGPSDGNHQRRFLAVGDGRRGLALFNAGLPEYAAAAHPEGVRLAVTLLRSVGWLSRDDLRSRPEGAGPALPTPGAQCLGEHRFELALMPFADDWDRGGVPAAAERFSTPPFIDATSGAAPGTATIELPEGLLLSALKRAESGRELIMRFWNPGRQTVAGALLLDRSPEAVTLVGLDESPLRELEPQARIPLSLEPKEVVSLAILFGGEAMA